jgi:hypothetical protein
MKYLLIALFLLLVACAPTAETCNGMSYQEAQQIAKTGDCSQGTLKTTHFCNEGTNTWWIDLNLEKQGCSPACVIEVTTKKAEINWRCTGLIPER